MQGKCIGFFRGVSKSGKPFRVATLVAEVPAGKGFGVRSEEVFLPADVPDPVLNRIYLVAYNRSGFCEIFTEVK